MINIDKILLLHKENIADWHSEMKLSQKDLPWMFIEENHQWNFSLWHQEDIVRIPDVDPIMIVAAKRNIDRFNQQRNDAIEKIDEWILFNLNMLNLGTQEKMHSETPGMMIDRLSIMALKSYHMLEETLRRDATKEHINICSQKLLTLDDQIADLANCLHELFEMLAAGELKFKVYRQFKMYNDPNLNPELYMRKQKTM